MASSMVKKDISVRSTERLSLTLYVQHNIAARKALKSK